jgi:F-type H+-transporting ATPase subunit alpha
VNGYLDDLPVTDVRRFDAEFLAFVENSHSDVLRAIREKKELPNELKQQIDGLINEFKQRFVTAKAAKPQQEKEVPVAKA